MDVNLVRAALWARARAKEARRKPALVILFGLASLPPCTLAVYLGFSGAMALPGVQAEGVGHLLSVLPLGIALAAAVWDGTPALDARPLRPFLAGPRSLFMAELALSFGTTFRRVQMGLLALLIAGAAFARPILLPWMVPAAGMVLVWLVCWERLAGRLTRLAGQHFRTALLLAGVLPVIRWVMRGTSELLLERHAMGLALPALRLPALPGAGLPGAWQAVLHGGRPWAAGLLVPLLWTLGLLGATGLALQAELAGESAHVSSGRSARWVFGKPWSGVARHQWHSLMRSRQGRFYLFLPLAVPLLMIDPMLFRLKPGPTWIIGSVGWMMLPLGGLACSLFGLDRGGVRTFWLLPLSDGDLLVGKLAGTAAYQLLFCLLFLPALALATPMPLRLLPACLAFCAALCAQQLRVGLTHAMEHPRPLDPARLNPSEMDDAHLLKLGRCLGPWCLLVALWFAASWLPVGLHTLVLVVAALFSGWSLRRALPSAEARLDALREPLTATLSAS